MPAVPVPSPSPAAVRASRFFVILNPGSGSFLAETVHAALARHLRCGDGSCEVHQMTGVDDLAALARSAVDRGCDAVVAAGGDGTVSAVAGALVGTDALLGIIPLGTANVLSKELGVPIDLDAACGLLAGEFAAVAIDALRIGDRHFFTQVGVGIDALMIRDTKTEAKKRFGRLAYLWTGLSRLVGFQPRRFDLEIDGRALRVRASQVLVANSGTLGQRPFQWGPHIRPDDGRADVCILRARTVPDYLGLAWHILRGKHRQSVNARYRTAERSVKIATKRPLPVQADGEIIGDTPIEVSVVPRAVRVIVPGGPAERYLPIP